MSAGPELNLMAPAAANRWQRNSLIVGVLGTIGAIIGWIIETDNFYRAFLLGYMWCLGLTLGCMAVLMIYHLTGGAWGTVARRILEAGMRTLPLMAVLFVIIPIGMHHLYPWARAEDVAAHEDLQRLAHSYLSPGYFIFRAVLYFLIWGMLTYAMDRISRRQDRAPTVSFDARLRGIAGPGEVLYAFTVSFAAVDWVMSISPPWVSTIYGLLFMAGQGVLTLSFVVIIGSLLVKHEPMNEVWRPDQFLDHGKLLMAFTMLWGWFTLSQWLIIWSGNLPDEISWYLNRSRGGWQYWAEALVLVEFALPFALLLSRSLKSNWRQLRWVALLLVLARYLDIYYIIMPSFENRKASFHYSWLDFVVPAGMAGLWLTYFFYNLKTRPLLARYDNHVTMLLEEGHEHEHAR
jgi:hypothetical protein